MDDVNETMVTIPLSDYRSLVEKKLRVEIVACRVLSDDFLSKYEILQLLGYADVAKTQKAEDEERRKKSYEESDVEKADND